MEKSTKIKTDSIKKNFIFQILYQFVIMVLPLITAPYLTRTLGKTELGYYTYIYSIASYFIIGANLGIVRHGQRIIAVKKNDEIALRKTFWSLYTIHIVLSLVSVLSYIIFASFQNENRHIYFIFIFYVASCLFDLTWLFYGLENFKSVVIKNFIVKIVETLLIFTLVKTSNDLWLYTLIMTGSICMGQLMMLPQAIRWVKPIRFSFEDCKVHFKGLLILSIAVISVSLYSTFDMTLLGALSNKENVAFYEYSNKIISIPKAIIGVVGTVLYPRACLCFVERDFDGMKRYFKYSIQFVYFIAIGAIFGLYSVSNLFSLLYYGENFTACGDVIKLLSPVILIVCAGDIVRTQILIPMKRDLLYSIILLLSAGINVFFNVVLIPIMGINGAIIGTLAAESFGTIVEMIICRKYISFKTVILSVIPFLICASCMVLGIELFKMRYNSTLMHLIVQICLGITIYLLLLIVWFTLISPERKNYVSIVKNIIKPKRKITLEQEICNEKVNEAGNEDETD